MSKKVTNVLKLDTMLEKMLKIRTDIGELEQRYEKLKTKAFPLVEAAGDVYEIEGIRAQIIRGKTWKVDAVLLLGKFGEKVHALLSVSASKFRKALALGLLGAEADLEGIAKLVDETPRFCVSKR